MHRMHDCMRGSCFLKPPLKSGLGYSKKLRSSMQQWRLFLPLWYTRRSPSGDKGGGGCMACQAASSDTPGECSPATGDSKRCTMMGTGRSRAWTTTIRHSGSWWGMTAGRPAGYALSMLARRSRMLHSCCICQVRKCVEMLCHRQLPMSVSMHIFPVC